MGKPYSGDLRERIYGEISGGESRRVGGAPLRSERQHRGSGCAAYGADGVAGAGAAGAPAGRGKLAPHRELLLGWVATDKDITIPELAARLFEARQVTVDPASLSRFLRSAGYSFKKTLLASEADRADVAEAGRNGGRTASRGWPRSPTVWCSSMRPARPPR
jgi:hypothetical protein